MPLRSFRKKATTLFDLLPQETLEELFAAGRLHHYAHEELIQQRGDEWRGVSVVKSGQAIAANMGKEGSFIPSSLMRVGDTFGEFTTFLDLPRTHSLWASGPTEIVHIEREDFLSLLEREPAIERALLIMTIERTHELVGTMDMQRSLPLPAQIARLLHAEAESDVPHPSVYCRQEDLAFMLGVSRVAIGKALGKLVGQGLIATGYGKIQILDKAKLARFLRDEDPL